MSVVLFLDLCDFLCLFLTDTEIQHVTFQKCFLNDEIFIEICNHIKNLRHLKSLIVPYNLLTSASVMLVIRSFGNSSRQLQQLDFRDNPILDEDGHRLYNVFSKTMVVLNGMEIEKVKHQRHTTLEYSDLRMRLPEVAVMCDMLEFCGFLTILDLSHNNINSDCLIALSNCLVMRTNITTVNLSHNPIMGAQNDTMEGIEAFTRMMQSCKHICHIEMEGIDLPTDVYDRLTISQQVNRTAVTATAGGMNPFVEFVGKSIRTRASGPPVNPLKSWVASLTIDRAFAKLNHTGECAVEVTGDFTGMGGGDIINLSTIADTRKRMKDF